MLPSVVNSADGTSAPHPIRSLPIAHRSPKRRRDSDPHPPDARSGDLSARTVDGCITVTRRLLRGTQAIEKTRIRCSRRPALGADGGIGWCAENADTHRQAGLRRHDGRRLRLDIDVPCEEAGMDVAP